MIFYEDDGWPEFQVGQLIPVMVDGQEMIAEVSEVVEGHVHFKVIGPTLS